MLYLFHISLRYRVVKYSAVGWGSVEGGDVKAKNGVAEDHKLEHVNINVKGEWSSIPCIFCLDSWWNLLRAFHQ